MGEVVFGHYQNRNRYTALWFSAGLHRFSNLVVVSVYGHFRNCYLPMIINYKSFRAENKDIIESPFAHPCKHFDKTCRRCMKYDKHPLLIILPSKVSIGTVAVKSIQILRKLDNSSFIFSFVLNRLCYNHFKLKKLHSGHNVN